MDLEKLRAINQKEKVKKIRGTYKIDMNKTPHENIIEILKKTMPVRLTLNKLKGSGEFNTSNNGSNPGPYDRETLDIDGVSISAMGTNKYKNTSDSSDWRRIYFAVRFPGRHWGRDSGKGWSVPIIYSNGERKISLSRISLVFNQLSELYAQSEKKENAKTEKLKKSKEHLSEVLSKSGLPDEVNLRSWMSKEEEEKKDFCAENSKFSITISLGQLNQEQVIEMGSLFTEIVNIKNRNFN